ncbi:alpha/beta fold hydrolase [Nocardia wallacei]|uniref:alpha/beta fold hydrolase n=1 Tax=Nocardia wallacei TaxID=480035 RepID=UPI00313C7171
MTSEPTSVPQRFPQIEPYAQGLLDAQRHPERVRAIVLAGVTMTRRAEIDWLYHGLARLLPREWEAFRDGVPPAERDGDLVRAYARLVDHPDAEVRMRAARDWCAWEDAVIAHEKLGSPGQYSAKADADMLAFVRICTHYFAHAAWLADDQLLRGADRLAGIPAVLVHGRLDLSGPLDTAWELARVWPDARLEIIEDSGHTGSPAMEQAILRAVADFGTR